MNRAILCDSGPLIALFDSSDAYHPKTLEFIKRNTDKLCTTLAVVTEVSYMLDFDNRAQSDFLEFIARGGIQVVDIDNADIDRIRILMEKYRDRPMDFADATVVHACEKLGIDRVISIDGDFSIYRIFKNRRIKNVLGV